MHGKHMFNTYGSLRLLPPSHNLEMANLCLDKRARRDRQEQKSCAQSKVWEKCRNPWPTKWTVLCIQETGIELRWSTFALLGFSWLLNHMIPTEAENVLFIIIQVKFLSFWVKIVAILWLCSIFLKGHITVVRFNHVI